jgi:DNA-binding LacI/PurR family transcriptional regulator
VRQPSYDLGHRAAELLLDEASGTSHSVTTTNLDYSS